jgi:hypothetical protein
MYFQDLPRFGRQPGNPLGHVIFWLDPVLRGAMTDQMMLGAVVVAIGFKEGGAALARELELQIKSYLKFYPSWLSFTRDRDRENKTQQRSRRRSAREEVGDMPLKGSRWWRASEDAVVDQLTGTTRDEEDPLGRLRVTLAGQGITELLCEHDVPDPHGIARMVLEEQKTQREVAQCLGISRQAVSKNLRKTYSLLIKRLVQRGELSDSARLQKGRWIPRA